MTDRWWVDRVKGDARLSGWEGIAGEIYISLYSNKFVWFWVLIITLIWHKRKCNISLYNLFTPKSNSFVVLLIRCTKI